MCPPNIVPDSLASWARMQVRGTIAARRYGSEPDIAAWANSCALNPARIEPSQRDDPAVKVAAARLADHTERGLTRMAELRTSHCRASRPSDCSESKARRASPNWESAWQLAKAASQLSPPSTTSSIRRSAPPMVVRRGVPEPAGGRRPQRLSDAVSGRDASRRRRSHGCASRRPPSLALRCSDCSEEVEMAKGQPFSVRLEEQTQRLVEAEAQRTRRTRSAGSSRPSRKRPPAPGFFQGSRSVATMRVVCCLGDRLQPRCLGDHPYAGGLRIRRGARRRHSLVSRGRYVSPSRIELPTPMRSAPRSRRTAARSLISPVCSRSSTSWTRDVLRLLLDANLSPKRIGSVLQKRGHDVLSLAADTALGALDDPQVLELAAEQGRILVTRELTGLRATPAAVGRGRSSSCWLHPDLDGRPPRVRRHHQDGRKPAGRSSGRRAVARPCRCRLTDLFWRGRERRFRRP